ncbi:MAG: hypothetical protein DMG87_04460 [Acidobacteria bacterium]|nr:MAG: hypothetical protein DMG87_04460 [Acidobacteriota bacterium]
MTDSDYAPKLQAGRPDEGVRRGLLRKQAEEAQSRPKNAAEQLRKALPIFLSDDRDELGGVANRG